MTRLIFKQSKEFEIYKIFNMKGEYLGWVEKTRVGAYEHWCLHTIKDVYYSAGCLEEVRSFIKNPERYAENFPLAVELKK